ncbi:MAG TPA: PEP-CTERM sorting domain-containing protein [Candidatus Sulfotelmatobacter sp.]|nr:PEP-CTERM sorting domain-containing protein [Candidatus Sulfotelmatobacter sp.]
MKIALSKIQSVTTIRAIAIGGAILALPLAGLGQSSYVLTDAVGSFLATGSAANPNGSDLGDLDFGDAGTFAIAPASSTKGEMDSILMFNTTAAVTQFNSLYGAGNWTITGITLSLASNFGVQGEQPNNGIFNTINAGNFGIDWLADNNWTIGDAGGMGIPGYPNNNYVSYDEMSSILAEGFDSLGTFTYTPPGSNIYLTYTLPLDGGLINAADGGDVSLYFYAADDEVSYLFNSDIYSANHPEFTLTAAEVPEPGVLTLLGSGVVWLLAARRRRAKP